MINDIYIYTKKMKKVIDAVALIEALINQNKTWIWNELAIDQVWGNCLYECP